MTEPTLYLFDGYNIMNAGAFVDVRELRDALASYVAVHGARGILVFDGAGVAEQHGRLAVRYATDADALLERLAAEHRETERVCLVSSDAAVRSTSGQEVMKRTSQAFVDELEPARHDEQQPSRLADRLDERTRAGLERLRRGSVARADMTARDVADVLERLGAVGVEVWVDGGWGVDALVGEQTRAHLDLDLALDRVDVPRARRALEEQGFRHDESVQPGLPARLVMRDARGRNIDLHPLAFDERGNGWQQLSETGRAWGAYPAEHLAASGVIDGRIVRCFSPELQLRFRLGYEWTERDEHDVALLRRLGVSVPPTTV